MTQASNVWKRRGIGIAFAVLTFFCWTPFGYGSYGPVSRYLGMPSWSLIAIGLAAVLFAIEWYYLFASGLAITDEQLDHMVGELKKLNADDASGEKKGGE